MEGLLFLPPAFLSLSLNPLIHSNGLTWWLGLFSWSWQVVVPTGRQENIRTDIQNKSSDVKTTRTQTRTHICAHMYAQE